MPELKLFIKKHQLTFTALAITAVTLLFYLFLNYSSENNLKIRFEKDSSVRIDRIFHNLETGVQQVVMLRAFYESSQEVALDEFRTFSEQLLKDNAIDGLALAMMPENSGLSDFIARASKLTGTKYTIKSLGPIPIDGINGHNNCLLLFVEPLKKYSRALGLNLLTENSRFKAIQESVKYNTVISTPPLFTDPKTGGKFFLYFLPVTKKQNGTRVKGVASAVFLADKLVSESINPTPPMNIHTDFYDTTGGGAELIYRWEPRVPDKAAGKIFLQFMYPRNITRSVTKEIAGRKWMITVRPGSVYLKNNYSLAYLLFIPVLALSLTLLFLYSRSMRNRAVTAEQAVTESEKTLAEKDVEMGIFFDTTIDLFCVADMNGKFLKLNREWERTLGYSLAELEGADFMNFVHPEDKEKTIKAMSLLTQGKNITDFTNRYMSKNGGYRYIQWRSVPYKNKYIYASARDITDHMRMENELRESEEIFKMAFQTIPDPTVINRVRDGKYVMVNDAYLKQSGYSMDDIMGKTSRDINIWADYNDRQKVVDALNNNKIIQNIEVKFRMKDKTINDCLVSGALISLYGEPHILLTARVITDIKKAQNDLRESEEKFRQVFMTSPDMISISTLDTGEFILVNDGFVKSTGYGRNEAEGKTSEELNIVVDYSNREKAINELKNAGSVANFESQIRKKDGKILDCIFTVSKIALNGEPRLVVTGRDISDRKRIEEELKNKEFWLRESQRIGQIGSYEFDIVNNSWACTKTLDGIFGIDERYNKTLDSWNLIVHPDDRKDMLDYFLGLMREKEQFDREYRIVRQTDKMTRWVYGRGVISFDNSGRALKMIGTIQDITERKNAEEAIRNSENRLRTLVTAAPMAIYMTNADGKCTFTNSLWNKISGLSQEEAMGDKWINGIYEEDRELIKREWNKMVESNGTWGLEYRFCDKNGKITWVYGTAAPIYYDENTITGYVGANVDISEQRLTHQKITESEAKLSSLILNMTEGVALHDYILDKNGLPVDYRIIDLNPQFEKIIGVKKESIVNKTSSEAYKTSAPPYLKEYLIPFKTGGGHIFETYFEPMDRHFLISVSPWGNNGFATIFSDISERKKHDAEREKNIRQLADKNAEMERFVYTVSHDLKNPLITIVGFAGVLKQNLHTLGKADTDKYLSLITESADNMNGLLNDLLEVSRVGRLVNLPEKTLFADLIDSALKAVAGEMKARNAVVSVSGSLKGINVNVDKKRLTEALQNLISNAIKFTPENTGPEVEIGMKIEYNKLSNVFYVRDKGMGIEKQYLAKIFGLFDRLHPEIEGTGVGLAIVKRIIEVHGGIIWAESEGPGRGTAFYFTLGR